MEKRWWGVEVQSTTCICRHPVSGEWVTGEVVGFNAEQMRSIVKFDDESRGWVNDEFISFEHEQKRLI